MTTMLLSTIMPSTTMSEARVMMFSGMPSMYMMPTLMNVERGMVMAATMALRRGKSSIMTMMMTAIDSMRLTRKSATLSSTTFGWSVMRSTSTSAGRYSSRKVWMTLFTSRP